MFFSKRFPFIHFIPHSHFATAFFGCLYSMAFQPDVLAPVMTLMLGGLFCQLERAPTFKATLTHTTAFIVAFICASMYWVGYAFTTIQMGYIGPVAVFFLGVMLAGFYLPLAAIMHFTKPYLCPTANALPRKLLFILGFAVCEWCRGHLFTGLPWNLTGHTWGMQALASYSMDGWPAQQFSLLRYIDHTCGLTLAHFAYDMGLMMMQCVHSIGIYGLSFITITSAVLLTPCKHTLNGKPVSSTPINLLIVAVLGGLLYTGAQRLAQHPTTLYHTHDHKQINIRLIQPCIDPNKKWVPSHLQDVLHHQIDLSLQQAERPLNAIIWPEAAIPIALNQEPVLRRILADILPKGAVLITGTVHHDTTTGAHHSALAVLDKHGTLIANHNKAHLLPFGEYNPFADFIPFEKFTPGTTDYSMGDGIRAITTTPLPPFLPLICFEGVFSGEVREKESTKKPAEMQKEADAPGQQASAPGQQASAPGQQASAPGQQPPLKTLPQTAHPQWLLNITNDAWYQNSVGLQQHLANVRFRAIEEGLPMVRVANNGISAVIDPLGRIVHHLRINDMGFIDFALPAAL